MQFSSLNFSVKECGENTLPFNDSTDALKTINFKKSYIEAPFVIVSSGHAGVNVSFSPSTTTECLIIGRTIRGNNLNENVKFSYIVIESQ